MIVFENVAGRLTTEEPARYLRVDWQDGPLPEEGIHQLLEQVLVALRERQLHKILFHQHHRGTLSVATSTWILLDWLPRAVQAGYQHAAFVLSRDLLSRLDTTISGREYSRRNPLPVYQFFEHEANALAWLLTTTDLAPKLARPSSTPIQPAP